jgi:hypothetical protein
MLARSPAATKKRRQRRRQRDGFLWLPIEVREYELVAALIEARRLTADESGDHAKLKSAVEGVLVEWCERWLHKS